MSDKNINNTETVNNTESVSSAERILQKIKERQNKEIVSSDEIIEQEDIIEDFSEELAEDIDSDIDFEKPETVIYPTDEIENEEANDDVISDYSGKSKSELLSFLNEIVNSDKILKFNKNIKLLKDEFYKIIETENEERKNKYLEDGGAEKDYEQVKDIDETTFKELYRKFNDKKESFLKKTDEEKKQNLQHKYEVIKEIDDLINKPESFSKTFNRFKELQKKWNAIGAVPKNDSKALFDDYNIQIQKFYEYLQVNKELRELDFKKNLELKIDLCEKAEELLLEPNFNKAKKELQTLHKKWKETGAVSNENREEIWKRFQDATIKINEKFSEYIEEIKLQQEKNLEAKEFLIQRAKEYSTKEYTDHQEWKDASVQVVELQKLWKKIGYVPKEHNSDIYKDFKNACDAFFGRIRQYYNESEKDKDDNYQKKLDLCIQAESLKESNEWNNTGEIFIQIQKEWKKIGPVPKKHSDEIWKRFRKACNTFFDRKKEYFKDKKQNEKENLNLKKEIINKINEFVFSGVQVDDLKKLKELQNEFLTVGYVPFEQKDEIYTQYHQAIENQLSKLNISKEKQSELKFNENLELIKNSPGSDRLAYKEIIKLQNQVDSLNDDIRIWENNIGFFSGSKKSESMVKNILDKINAAKNKVQQLKENIRDLENIK